MKAIMISIKPQHLVNILNGKKTIEIRKNKALASAIKNLIQEEGCATIYVYCCYGLTLSKGTRENELTKDGHLIINKPIVLNGKIVCCFKCYKVEDIKWCNRMDRNVNYYIDNPTTDDEKQLLQKSCLSFAELDDYLKSKNGYAIHISDLKIFDEPKELSEFARYKPLSCVGCCEYCENKKCMLTKAPQNFAYVEILTYN